MPEREDPKHHEMRSAGAPAAEIIRKLPRARRLLTATIGAATLQFIGGCKGGGLDAVANLMVPPNVPRAGQGQIENPLQGSAGNYVANLMAPPFIPRAGASGQRGGAGVSGKAGSSGAAGAHAADTDAGKDDDAGHA